MNFSFYQGEEKEWDLFVSEKSINGTFLQTRKFINYHPDKKFKDCSICIRKGKELVATVLACEIIEEGNKVFFAHKGTTFGGITIAKNIYTATLINELISGMIDFLKENKFTKIYLKMVPNIYQKSNADLVDYFLYKYGFTSYSELNYYLSLDRYKDDISTQFTASKRRDYRYSLKSGLTFKKLETKEEIEKFYNVLLMNLRKLNLQPVHSLGDLYDLKFNRFSDNIEFYGVLFGDEVVAGSMLFYFGENIVHTQYLSSNQKYLHLFPMDYLIYNLIKVSIEKEKKVFSFGICTENQGRYLNLGLSRFKEGFGTDFCINRSYEISI